MTKVKYSYQRDSYSCGPIALYNIMKWAGQKVSLKELIEVCGGRDEIKKIGTDVSVFNNVLLELPGIEVYGVWYQAGLNLINNHLKTGGIVALSYLTDECGHYALIVGRTKKCYLVVNAYENRAVSAIPRRIVRKMLDVDDFCLGMYTCSVEWFIGKGEK